MIKRSSKISHKYNLSVKFKYMHIYIYIMLNDSRKRRRETKKTFKWWINKTIRIRLWKFGRRASHFPVIQMYLQLIRSPRLNVVNPEEGTMPNVSETWPHTSFNANGKANAKRPILRNQTRKQRCLYQKQTHLLKAILNQISFHLPWGMTIVKVAYIGDKILSL